MTNRRTLATAAPLFLSALLATTTACGSGRSAPVPKPPLSLPAGGIATDLGPVTKSYVAWDGSQIDPPPAGARPRIGFAAVINDRCRYRTECAGSRFRLTASLASVTATSGPDADHRLMYVVDETGIRCDTIVTGGPQVTWTSSGPEPWPRWCRGIGFIAADGSELPRWGGVGPMPGQ